MMNSFRSAAASVGIGGLNIAAWLKATMSAGLVDWLIALPANGIGVGKSMFHSLAPVVSLGPWRIGLPLW